MSRSPRYERDALSENNGRVCISRAYYDDTLTQAPTYDELQVLLATIRLLSDPANGNSDVDEESILQDTRLNALLATSASSQSSTSRIIRALNQAVVRGALTRSSESTNGRQRILYRLSEAGEAPPNRETGEASAFDGDAPPPPSTHNPQAASVYAAYEENIGMLTPLVADQIRLALELYPASWIHEAMSEAVAYNRRQWRYIQRVLQNWSADGRISGPAHEVNHATNRRGPARAIDTD